MLPGNDNYGAEQRPIHATLIYNPAARHRDAAAAVAVARATLAARGWTVHLTGTDRSGAATNLAHQAVQRGDDAVIVAGGDGTINEAVQSLAGTPVALGVVPVGTVNVWAREIGLPVDPLAAAELLVDGIVRSVDLGVAGERYFLLMAGAGFDGAVTGLVEPELKQRMGRWAYALTAAQLAIRYGGTETVLEMDSAVVRCRLLLAVVGNTRLYAGKWRITANAVADDGLLDVVIFPGRKPIEALPGLMATILRRPTPGPGVLYYRTRHLRISAEKSLSVQADGDYIGATPLDFDVARNALRVIVPRHMHSPLFTLPASAAQTLERIRDA